MATELMALARRHARPGAGEGNEEKGHKGNEASAPFAPLSPISSGPVPGVGDASVGWGCRAAEVARLLADADEYVERSGVSGTHPAVRAAAEQVASAVATWDAETVRFAVVEFRAVVCSVLAGAMRSRYVVSHVNAQTEGGYHGIGS